MNWYNNDKKIWKEIIETVSNEIGKDLIVVEKDMIQSIFLYNIGSINKNLVFKGGTSLSKAYGIIERFSEDIDISFNKDPSESEKKNIKLLIEEQGKGIGLNLKNSSDIKSRYDYNKYIFSFNSLFTDLPQEILIETSFFQTSYPVEKYNVTSLIGKFCDKKGIPFPIECNALSFEMSVQSMRRTFVDKIFPICDYYLHNMSERYSIHLYDICKIYDNINFDDSLKELVKKVREDRAKLKSNPSANQEYNINSLLSEIIDKRFYEKDYNKLTSKLVYEDIDYDFAIANGIQRVIKTNAFANC